jgi:hypothetical protein
MRGIWSKQPAPCEEAAEDVPADGRIALAEDQAGDEDASLKEKRSLFISMKQSGALAQSVIHSNNDIGAKSK